MASLLAPAAPSQPDPRASQILPTVKCSSCGKPVKLDELGDHVCPPATPTTPAPPPAGPSTPAKPATPALPPPSRADPTALLPQRLQSRVARVGSPSPSVSSGSDRSSIASTLRATPPPEQRLAGRPTPPPFRAGTPEGRSILTRSPSPYEGTPPRAQTQSPVPPAPAFARAPEVTRERASTAPSVERKPSATVVPLPDSRPSTPLSVAPPRAPFITNPGERRPSLPNTALPSNLGGGSRPSTPATISAARPFITNPGERRPSLSSITLGDTRPSPSVPVTITPVRPFIQNPGERRPSVSSLAAVTADARPNTPASINNNNGNAPPTIQTPRLNEMIETRSGGEAGMAGVGRRGFAAAARAAMFATGPSLHNSVYAGPMTLRPPLGEERLGTPQQGMDGRRMNAPRTLDINTDPPSRTPPLSPNSGSQSSYSPSTPHSPSGSSINESARVTPKPAPPEQPSTPRLPFFEKFKNKVPAVETQPAPARRSTESARSSRGPVSPGTESESGLAYARSESSDGARSPEVRTKPLAISKSLPTLGDDAGVLFPSTSVSPPSPAALLRGAGPTRSISSASAYSSKTASALMKTLDPLVEDEEGAGLRVPRSPENKAPRLPTRALTSPTSPPAAREAQTTRRRKERRCTKCDKAISDGRWIKTDGPGVLCEKCWKNMYLPKCRRCNLTIEKAAVSSSDGKLQGKYHRECFNCHTCQKPFPDKEFYVFDGKPYCAYHYHEANESLCASATCGQPIEGPCAVSHSGDRYHPEHLTCEHELPGTHDGVRARTCGERLVDYWEVDGRMLCERHARRAGSPDGEGGARTHRATKRTTRFIDLAQLNGSDLR